MCRNVCVEHKFSPSTATLCTQPSDLHTAVANMIWDWGLIIDRKRNSSLDNHVIIIILSPSGYLALTDTDAISKTAFNGMEIFK